MNASLLSLKTKLNSKERKYGQESRLVLLSKGMNHLH